MYLECFIKPFIKNYSMISQYNLGIEKWVNYINPAYISKLGEPEFIEYKYSDKIIPLNIFNNFNIFVAKKYFPNIIFPLNISMTIFIYAYLFPLYIPVGVYHDIFKLDGYNILIRYFRNTNMESLYDSESNKINQYVLTGKFINIYDNYYEAIHIQNVERKQKFIDSIKKQLLLNNINPEVEPSEEEDDSNIIIKNNSLTIINYNKPELNLCDYLPKLIKTIEKDGKMITVNYTNIEKVHIVNCCFVKITKYYQGIIYMSLLDCPKFKSMPHFLEKDLVYFSIDGEKKINLEPPSY